MKIKNNSTMTKLIGALDKLEAIYREIEFIGVERMFFLDLAGYFHYIEDILQQEGRGPGASQAVYLLLEEIKGYIPITVRDEKMDILLEAITSDNDGRVHFLEKRMKEESTISFMSSLCMMKTDEEWEYVKELFVDIQAYVKNQPSSLENEFE